MKTAKAIIFFIIALGIYIGYFFLIDQKTFYLTDKLIVKDVSSIENITIERIDNPSSKAAVTIENRDEINLVWEYLKSIKLKSPKDESTYKEHKDEFSIVIQYDGGNHERVDILNQGAFITQSGLRYWNKTENFDHKYLQVLVD